MKVSLPERLLLDAGIPPAHLACSLREMTTKAAKSLCRKYTMHAAAHQKRGWGVTIYGKNDAERANALYGIAKALLAQRKKVLVCSVPEIAAAYFEDKTRYAEMLTTDVLAIRELDVPDEVVNKGVQSAVYGLLQGREQRTLPVLCATALEVEHPERCVDSVFPGAGDVLKRTTLLVNLSGAAESRWLKEGHLPNRKLGD